MLYIWVLYVISISYIISISPQTLTDVHRYTVPIKKWRSIERQDDLEICNINININISIIKYP